MRTFALFALAMLTGLSSAFAKTQFVYFLNENGAYAYYDQQSKKQYYWKRTLEEAKQNSVVCPDCEIFVFERARTKGGATPKGKVTHFSGGKAVKRASYHVREAQNAPFQTEGRILARLAGPSEVTKRYLFYFGHSIPHSRANGAQSLGESPFTVSDFFSQIRTMTRGQKLDLLVLSTCENGDPTTITSGANVAHSIIASPSQLHLSMMTTSISGRANDPNSVASDILRGSYASLAAETKTEITLAHYDTTAITHALNKSPDMKRAALDLARKDQTQPTSAAAAATRTDCADTAYSSLAQLPIQSFEWQAHLLNFKKLKPSGWSCSAAR